MEWRNHYSSQCDEHSHESEAHDSGVCRTELSCPHVCWVSEPLCFFHHGASSPVEVEQLPRPRCKTFSFYSSVFPTVQLLLQTHYERETTMKWRRKKKWRKPLNWHEPASSTTYYVFTSTFSGMEQEGERCIRSENEKEKFRSLDNAIERHSQPC